MPKRHPFHTACSRDFSKVLRDSDDLAPIRKKTTPKPEIIADNLNKFVQKWESIAFEERYILNVKALNEIRKLQKHVTKGCISDIPIGAGSERNENLHKWLKNALQKNRMSVALALALFTTFFYAWNEKRLRGGDTIVPPVDCLISKLTDDFQSESFGISQGQSAQDISKIFYKQVSKDQYNVDLDHVDTTQGINTQNMDNVNTLTQDESLSIIKQALILYVQYKSMKEKGILSIFNPRSLNLMHQQVLFSFDTFHSKSSCLLDNNTKLEKLVSGLGFDILQVPADGDCLFTSILLQFDQILSLAETNDLNTLVQNMGLINKSLSEKVIILRDQLVNEWLANKEEYQKFLVDTELEEMASQYRRPGVFTGEIGNMMLLGLANVLQMSFILFTTMEHFPIIPVSPRVQPLVPTPLYLAFNHAGPGHYDAVIFHQETLTLQTDNLAETKSVEDQPKKSCRCGKGGASKRSADGRPKPFCIQVPGERRTLCPCFLAQRECSSSCKCFNCSNSYGKQQDSKEKGDSKFKRVRHEHFVQHNKIDNLNLIRERNVEIINSTSWSEFETLLFESMLNRVMDKTDMSNESLSYLMDTFNGLCTVCNCNNIPLPVNSKTKKQIEGKLKYFKQQAMLFHELYLNQVKFNFYSA